MTWMKHNLCYLWRAHSKLAKPFNYARIVHKMQRLAYFLSLYSLFSTVGQQQDPNTEKPVRAEHVIFLQHFNIVHLSSIEFLSSTFVAVSYTLTWCHAYFIFVRGGRKKNPFWFNLNRQNSSGIPVGKQLAVVQAVSGRSPALARSRWWASVWLIRSWVLWFLCLRCSGSSCSFYRWLGLVAPRGLLSLINSQLMPFCI